MYPLSPRRPIPDHIPKPEWHKDGQPKYKMFGRNNIPILDKKAQDAMRKVCRLSREVLDIVGREVRPGVTTDYLDEIVHKACIERNVRPIVSSHTNIQTNSNLLRSRTLLPSITYISQSPSAPP